jgi:hypothetical protein
MADRLAAGWHLAAAGPVLFAYDPSPFFTRSYLMNRRSFLAAALVAVTVLVAAPPGAQSAETKQSPAKTPQAWTLDEALGQLQFNPDDVYLQYVAMQLARNAKRTDEVARQIESLTWRRAPLGPQANRRVDLFDLFTGALAVQESLQLDSMRGREDDWIPHAADPARNTVKVSSLTGPTVKSHPWGKMLAAQTVTGNKPAVSPLSLYVPEDQYYVEFRTLTKLLETAEAGDLWGDHLFLQTAKSAQTHRAADRIKGQLAMQTDPLTRPFYDMVVNEVVLTGSDLYFREGTDITMIFQIKQPEVFRARMDGFLEAAQKSRNDAVRSTGKVLGVEYVSVTTPDRAISAYSAYPKPDIHVRSNSKVALERVLAAIDGKQGTSRLGETTEFKYIRTLMVRGDKREDGFVYLSDPFIRRVVGPEQKLTERRRLLCYNHLRMIGHGAMLFHTQFGRAPKSLEEIVESGCAPAPFATAAPARAGKDALFCPCGGAYSLSDDGAAGVCSYHGHAQQLLPCLEIPQQRVTEKESQEYQQFLAQYSNYWRRYFDPIAIRIQVSPKQYRAETIILPLIDNSIYSGLAMALGGEVEPLDALPVPKRNIFSVAVRINKEPLLKNFEPLHGLLRDLSSAGITQRPGAVTIDDFLRKGIGNQVGLHVYDAVPMFDLNMPLLMGESLRWFGGAGGGSFRDEVFIGSFLIGSLNAPVYAAIPVKDAKVVDKFLDELDASLAALARRRETGGFLNVDHDYYKVPLPGADQRIRCYAIGIGPVKWRVFFARLGDGLYLASKQFVLEDLAALADGKKPADTGPEAHAMVRIRPDHWKEVLPEYRLGWEENARQACLNNLGPMSSVARAMAAAGTPAGPAADVGKQADRLHAVHFFCPDGGKYEVSADGKDVTCSVHGSAAAPKQLAAPAPNSPTGKLMKQFAGATAQLTFLEDGLHAIVTIDRK